MKVIRDCPRCKKDFMYDPNHDYHLFRDNNVICQDCNELEKTQSDPDDGQPSDIQEQSDFAQDGERENMSNEK